MIQIDVPMMEQTAFRSAFKRVEAFLNKSSVSNVKILVVGDVGVDKYLYGEVSRISPEAPVPVLVKTHEEVKLGLSANVAQNVVSLGAQCDLLSVCGEDLAGQTLKSLLSQTPGLNPVFIKSEHRPTTEKTRVLSGPHHLLRVDVEESKALSLKEQNQVIKALEKLSFSDYNCVILEDYGKGFLTQDLTQIVIQKAQKAGVKVLVDPSKGASLEKFKGADIFKPNQNETLAYQVLSGGGGYSEVLEWVLKKGEFKHLVSTLGPQGMSLVSSSERFRIPTFAKKVFDVTGAGDTVVAALAFSLSSGLDIQEACVFANLAAGFVVGKVGAVPCSIKQIQEQAKKTPLKNFA